MTGREFLEAVARMKGEAPHSDACRECRVRRMYALVAREMLDRNDVGEDVVSKWTVEAERRRKLLPHPN
jgi:hypothetical protein